ncbi:MAG: hypothetical protein K1X78_19110 [Verrucomicrobiaceae bacterium]|nr:hypothetical protein [Verrucomicrobiaceae bacterium]
MLRSVIFHSLAFLSVTSAAPAEALRWFKGNTHTHSLWSDGNDFPDMISEWYRSHGYDFLAMSDHNLLARGDKWVTEELIEKKKIVLGKKVLDKYRARFGDKWVETRTDGKGRLEVRLKPLEEYRRLVEKPGKFLLVEAEEISAGMGKAPIHINAVNLHEAIKPVKDLTSIREVMRQNLQLVAGQAAKTGKPIIAHVNHPNFQWALTAEDLAHVIEDRYFEVFNGHPKTFTRGDDLRATSNTEKIWDVANTIRLAELKAPILYGVATDDSHNYHGGDVTPGRGWVMVRAAKLDADALVSAMQRGDFYGSTGVTLDEVKFDATTRKLSIKIKGESGVSYSTEFRGTLKNYDRAVKEVPADPKDPHPVRLEYTADVGKVLAKSDSLTPEYQMTGAELFVRATITSTKKPVNPVWDTQTEQAWTQPAGWEK